MVTATIVKVVDTKYRAKPKTMCEVTWNTLGTCERSWCQCMSLHALKILRFRGLSFCCQLVSLSFWLSSLLDARTLSGSSRLKFESSFIPSSYSRFMSVLSVSSGLLFDLSIHFISSLFISLIFLHFRLPYYFLDVVDDKPAHFRWGAGSPGLQGLLHRRSRIVRYVDMFRKIHFFGWKTTGWYSWSGWDWQESKQPTDTLWPEIRKDKSEASKFKEKQKWAIEKPKLDNARRLRGVYFIAPADDEFKDIMKKKKKRAWKAGSSDASCNALLRLNVRSTGKLVALKRRARQVTLVLLKPMDLWRNAWKDLLTRIMKIILCLKQRKMPDAKAAVDEEWENSRKCQCGSWRMSERKKRWSLKPGMRAKPKTLRRWWTSVISRIRSWRHSFRNIKVELCSEVTW